MNITFLRNLSDSEFLKHIDPQTDLEKLLVDRLENPDAEPNLVDELRSELAKMEDECEEAEREKEDTEEDLEALRAYAVKLHAALAIAEPESGLLDCDEYELLRA